MNSWMFYDLQSGVFLGEWLIASDPEVVKLSTPAGHDAMPGRYDPLSQRVDIAEKPPVPRPTDGDEALEPWYPPVIDYQPPAPEDTDLLAWTWDEKARRWVSQPTEQALKLARVRELQDAIEAREAAQARPLREMIIALVDGKAAPEAKAKLVAIEADVAALRAEIADEAKQP